MPFSKYFLCVSFFILFHGASASETDSLFIPNASGYNADFFRTLRQKLAKLKTDQAVLLLNEEITKQEAQREYRNAVNLKIVLGLILKRTSNADGFIKLQDAIAEADQKQFLYEKALALFESGRILLASGEKTKALESFLKAEEACAKTSEKALLFQISFAIANLQYSSDNFEEALLAMQNGVSIYSIEEWLEQEDYLQFDVMRAFNTMALCHLQMEEFDEALDNYKVSLIFAQARQDEFWNGLVTGNMGHVLLRQNKLDTAEALLQYDLGISKKYKAFSSVAATYLSLAQLHQKQNLFQEAEKFFDSASYVINSNNLSLPSYFKRRSELAYEMRKYKTAIDLRNIYDRMADSLSGIKKSKDLALLNSNFEFLSKLETVKLLEKENLLKDEELKNKNLIIFGGTFITFLAIALSVVVIRSNRLKIKLNKELEREVEKRTRRLASTVKELDTFIYRLSHDFRRPLTTLIGLDSLGRTISKDSETNDLFSKVGKTAKQMDRMLLKMTYIHEVNTLEPTITQTNLREVVEEVIAGFGEDFSALKTQLIVNVPDDMIVSTDPRFLQLILTNLIENAFIFVDEGKDKPIISIGVKPTEGGWKILISDNGVGISLEVRSRIYEPFFRGSSISQGNGLGLYLVKKATRRLRGKVVDYAGDHGESVFMLEFFVS
ncbi:MAG: ATP-binding protein [Imperialibacter sp.]|uniref:tetratricopeptide repeat-containing sensor histidine kinase n=1 Tax=Imperialibacter sp. TaxID=2038411 RepID=UPI0032EFBA75